MLIPALPARRSRMLDDPFSAMVDTINGMIAEELIDLAQVIACRTPGFLDRKGPGKDKGNGATDAFLMELNCAVRERWPTACVQQERALTGAKYSFDFFIPSEQTAVEIALSLRNVVTEFEKDIFKAILAKDGGKEVKRLILVGKHGAIKRLSGAGPRAIIAWAARTQLIEVHIKDLGRPDLAASSVG